MSKVRIALLAVVGLAMGVAAATAGAVVTSGFHGVRILESQSTEESDNDGRQSVATLKIGPYTTDSVILLDDRSETRFQSTTVGPVQFGGMQTELREDDQLMNSNVQKANVSGLRPMGLGYEFRQKTLFLKRGEVKTIALVTKPFGTADMDNTGVMARLHMTAIAASE